ncbi:MAG: hypothetical protein ACRDEA_18135, partial [Microcystaceae cyanobacterium]
ACGMVLGSSAPASAAGLTWNWSYSGNDVLGGSGTLMTKTQPTKGAYLVTSITGTAEGGSISLLPVNSLNMNDNLLKSPVPQVPQLTSNGASFNVSYPKQPAMNFSGNIFYNTTANNYEIRIPTQPNLVVTFSATQVSGTPETIPEPSNLLGCITLGGLMLGSALRKARQ